MPKLEFHEVDAARWRDFERLFESRGGPKSCWCMVWRAGAKTSKGVDRKFAIHRYVSNETPIGLLGYSEGEPVAWCSIAPRPPTVILAARTGLANYPNKYGRW